MATSDQTRTFNKLRALQEARAGRRKSTKGCGELMRVLRQQRVYVDESAIHFVSEARAGPRADARNSVFKLRPDFEALPEKESESRLRKVFSGIQGQNDDSGDEGWEHKFADVPDALRTERGKSIFAEQNREQLLDAIANIEAEAEQLPEDIVTREQLDDAAVVDQAIKRYSVAPGLQDPQQREQLAKIAEHAAQSAGDDFDENDDEDEDDDDFTIDDVNTLNDMQREFVGNNLLSWMASMEAGYAHGVILVKVNALGVGFIRNVTIKDFRMTISQPHNFLNKSINPRTAALTSIESVQLGRASREFQAMEKRVKDGLEAKENFPSPKLCTVVHLPAGRTLSLVFVQEEQRNGFVFFLRVLLQKAREAAAA
ncbi:hypothetical protein BESB_073180 [Besnoitia besnoiti]|uniref:Uncharacterized protein n=1 Tax=Besnoitia besnoiti TaxID=94643 RepID=A0A2A9MDY9_BESBE|nr:uncharacterized protein BESB_073180 [Besnoitia besnoiti]PFH34166.1 hypothetical protein BESB_073180 [Besnoitia besnoiti]